MPASLNPDRRVVLEALLELKVDELVVFDETYPLPPKVVQTTVGLLMRDFYKSLDRGGKKFLTHKTPGWKKIYVIRYE